MSVDAELDVWRREWQSGTALPSAGQRRKVQRQTSNKLITLLAEFMVTAGIGGGAADAGLRRGPLRHRESLRRARRVCFSFPLLGPNSLVRPRAAVHPVHLGPERDGHACSSTEA